MGEDFHFRRRQTWPDTPDDGLGKDDRRPYAFARVYRQAHAAAGMLEWYWTVADTLQIASGFAEDKESAKAATEAAYVAYLKRVGDNRAAEK